MGKPGKWARILAAALCLLLAARLFADDPTTQPDPDAVRLTFLGDRLSSVEASIKAINHALVVAGYKQSVAAGQAATYQQGNEIMNRNGGGPVDWQDFYGRTAKSFIVRDTISAAAISAGPNGVGVAALEAQGRVRSIPRPPEFNYVYKANNDAITQANAEVAQMGKQTDLLIARRRQLEAEQSMLWATIVFESIENREIPLRPLYHYQLAVKPSTTNDNRTDGARLAVERALVLYLKTVDHAVSNLADGLELDQRSAYRNLRDTVQRAQGDMQEATADFSDTPGVDAGDVSQVNEVVSLAKRMGALCKNTCDSYDLALDGDKQGDEQRKETFRGQLQESLMAFAETTAQMDIALVKLAAAWEIHGQVGKANTDRTGEIVVASTVTPPAPAQNPVVESTAPPEPQVAPRPAHGPDPVTLDDFTNRLNGQITNWTIVHGNFVLTSDGKLEGGESDSQVNFKHSLPGDLNLSMQVNVISGSHPTIDLGGPSLIIGDFSGNKTLAVKSNQVLVPGSFTYQNGQDIPISIQVGGGTFKIVIGDQTISGTCLKVDRISLGLRAGLKGNSKVDFSEFLMMPPGDAQHGDSAGGL